MREHNSLVSKHLAKYVVEGIRISGRNSSQLQNVHLAELPSNVILLESLAIEIAVDQGSFCAHQHEAACVSALACRVLICFLCSVCYGCSKNLSMMAEKAPKVRQPAQAAFGPALAARVPPAKHPAYMLL